MKNPSLRHYPTFVQAVANFVLEHGLTTMPTSAVYRRLRAETLAHHWREYHREAPTLKADVEARLGRALAGPEPALPRARLADYPGYLARLRAWVGARDLTHLPTRGELVGSGFGLWFSRHQARHDLAADLGLRYRLDATRIPAAYLAREHNVRDLLEQFLALHGLAHVPHEQQLWRFKHSKKLAKMVGPLMAATGLSWAEVVPRLGLTLDPDVPRKRPEDYTAAEVAAEVKALCVRLGRFPTSEEFGTLGLDYLLGRVRARFGTAHALAVQLGYPRQPGTLVADDGHRCASHGEWRTDQALIALGVAHRSQAHLLAARPRSTADFAVEGPGGVVAIEVLMFDPDAPRPEVARCIRYLARFALKAAAYRAAGIGLVNVVSTHHPDAAALEGYLRQALTGYGVSVAQTPILPGSAAPAAAPAPEDAPAQKPPEYWTVFDNVLREVKAIVDEHGLTEIPPAGFFSKIGRHDVRGAVPRYWSRQEIGTALGLPVAAARRVPRRHWDDPANVEAALLAHVGGRVPPSAVFPTVQELRRAKNHPLANVVAKLPDETLDTLAARVGLVRRPTARKPPGYWQDRANVLAELRALAQAHGLTVFPTFAVMQQLGRAGLADALTAWRPEERDAMARELGLGRKMRRSPRRGCSRASE